MTADVIYNSVKTDLLNGVIDFATDSIYVMWVTSAYTPDQDAHKFLSDITNEVVGSGYVAGGTIITSPTVIQDDTDNEGVFDGADITWPNATITARGAVLYKNTAGDSTTDPLVFYIDFTEDKSSSAGNFTLEWNAEGILNQN